MKSSTVVYKRVAYKKNLVYQKRRLDFLSIYYSCNCLYITNYYCIVLILTCYHVYKPYRSYESKFNLKKLKCSIYRNKRSFCLRAFCRALRLSETLEMAIFWQKKIVLNCGIYITQVYVIIIHDLNYLSIGIFCFSSRKFKLEVARFFSGWPLNWLLKEFNYSNPT